MIDAGKLRERVTWQSPSESRNALGESVAVWSDHATVWASVEGVSSREFLLSGQQQVEMSHRIRCRYVPGLNQQMRASWRGRTLEIVTLLEHANRSEHEAICQETT